MSGRLRRFRRQRGVALVETAISLPVLLFLMLAVGEVTNAFMQHNTLTKAARDGARYAAGQVINHGVKVFSLSTDIINDTRSLVVYGTTMGTGTPVIPNLTMNDVTVSSVGGEVVEVRVVYPYSGILGAVLPAFGLGSGSSLTFNLEATVRMRGL